MNAIKRNLIAGAISMIGKENISEMVTQVIQGILAKKKELPLSEGESEISALFYEVEGEIYYSTVGVREGDNQEMIITRFIHVQKISQLIESAIKALD
jgi:hypothetical protein